MGKFYTAAAAALLWANALIAQGTVLFTWHGDSNFFQATFQVTAAEMQPGTSFDSPLFLSSMSVTNPDGQTYHGGGSSSAGTGSWIPFGLHFQLNDFGRGTELIMIGGDFGTGWRTAGVMWEQVMSTPSDLWYEPGHWTVAQIPEPSTTALLGLAAILLACNIRRGK